MDVGVLQAGAPATVTNLTNADSSGGSDNTRRRHQVKCSSTGWRAYFFSSYFGPSIPQYLLIVDYLEGFEETWGTACT